MSCSPPEGQYKRKHRSYSEFTRNEFYDNFSMHFFKIYAEKTCTKVVTVLTIHNALVICSLVLMKLYRSPARQIHQKIPNCALSGKILPAKYGEKPFVWKQSRYLLYRLLARLSNQELLNKGALNLFANLRLLLPKVKKWIIYP